MNNLSSISQSSNAWRQLSHFLLLVCVCACVHTRAKGITGFSSLLSLVKVSRPLPCPGWNLLHFECSLKLQCKAWNTLLLTTRWGVSSTVDYCLGDTAWQLHCTSALPSSQLINPPFSSLTVNTVCFPSSVSQIFSPPHSPTATTASAQGLIIPHVDYWNGLQRLIYLQLFTSAIHLSPCCQMILSDP